nr:hypothetical protein [Methylococcus capsulatus]
MAEHAAIRDAGAHRLLLLGEAELQPALPVLVERDPAAVLRQPGFLVDEGVGVVHEIEDVFRREDVLAVAAVGVGIHQAAFGFPRIAQFGAAAQGGEAGVGRLAVAVPEPRVDVGRAVEEIVPAVGPADPALFAGPTARHGVAQGAETAAFDVGRAGGGEQVAGRQPDQAAQGMAAVEHGAGAADHLGVLEGFRGHPGEVELAGVAHRQGDAVDLDQPVAAGAAQGEGGHPAGGYRHHVEARKPLQHISQPAFAGADQRLVVEGGDGVLVGLVAEGVILGTGHHQRAQVDDGFLPAFLFLDGLFLVLGHGRQTRQSRQQRDDPGPLAHWAMLRCCSYVSTGRWYGGMEKRRLGR